MDRAAEAAREGNMQYFVDIDSDELIRLCKGRDEDQRSLAHSAAVSGNLELLSFILARSSQETVNAADESGWTPLMSACSCSHIEVAKYLLSLGASATATNSQGRTSMHYAASKGNTALLQLLLDSGASPTVKDCTASIPLHRAAASGRIEALRLLVDFTPAHMIDARDISGGTPLLLAAGAGHRSAAILLAGHGANVEAEDEEGQTPLGAAAVHGAGLREVLVALATGEATLDDIMEEG